jgi:hypothetical protein
MPTQRHAPADLTALDWIALVLGVHLVGTLALFPFLISPAFARMYHDFGSAPLPLLTRWALSRWMPLLLAIPPAACLTVAFVEQRVIGVRRGLIVAGFFVALLSLMFCVVTLYLPIFQLAGNIKAD